MLKPPDNLWNEAYLLSLIQDQVEESLHLDYKACDALNGKTDGKKNELSKDISAFANSDGGVIIYGVLEGQGVQKHLPVSLDSGFDPTDVSKEWLEGVINSRIQRRISGLRIHPIELKTNSPGKYAYAVEIPQSRQAPHQASDKRYYKRYNFESVPMEDYEVRDVMNRQSGPDLWVEYYSENDTSISTDSLSFSLKAAIRNLSKAPAHNANITVWVDTHLNAGTNFIEEENFTLPEGTSVQSRKYLYVYSQVPIFGKHSFGFINPANPLFKRHGMSFDLDKIRPQKITELVAYIMWEIEAPNMTTRRGIEKIYTGPEWDALKSTTLLHCENVLREVARND